MTPVDVVVFAVCLLGLAFAYVAELHWHAKARRRLRDLQEDRDKMEAQRDAAVEAADELRRRWIGGREW